MDKTESKMESLEQDFAQIVREHKGTIYTVCYMFSKNEEEVADLFQDILVNLWNGFRKFRGDSSPGTWIYRVSLNTCISSERKKKRRGETVPLGTIFAGIFAVIFAPVTFYVQGCSLIFVIATAIMLAVCLGLTIVQRINLGSMLELSQDNLVETARKLSKVRTHYKEWYRIAIPMILVWVGWMIYEMVNTIGIESPTAIGFYCGAGVGLLIGGIIGFRINRKVVRQANEILAQIEELQQS